jgi:hypothetical protein
MVRRWGPRLAAIIAQQLHELEAVESLADLQVLPHLRLSADTSYGRARVEGPGGVRVDVRWDAGQEESADSSVLWSKITAVIVHSIAINGAEEGRGMSHGR